MAWLQALFFLLGGGALLLLTRRAWRDGAVPVWGYGFGNRVEYARDAQPLRFWLASALYGIAGLSMTLFALRLLAGTSAPLPLS